MCACVYVYLVQDGTEPTIVQTPGFKIKAVQFDDKTSQWLVDVQYTPGIPNTITSMYVSKPGTTLPYPLNAKNTYYMAKHPCVIYNAVCCLNDYRASYEVGVFSQNITSAIGSCNSTVQGMNTIGMFDPSGNQYIIDNLFTASYPDSSVTRISASEVRVTRTCVCQLFVSDCLSFAVQVRLRIAQTDLSVGGLAMRSTLESNPTGYQLNFFVGMTYMTLLEANAMSVTATQVCHFPVAFTCRLSAHAGLSRVCSCALWTCCELDWRRAIVLQTAITLAISNSISFSYSSSQDYSLVKYVTLTVMQNRWLDDMIQREMQFVQVCFSLVHC